MWLQLNTCISCSLLIFLLAFFVLVVLISISVFEPWHVVFSWLHEESFRVSCLGPIFTILVLFLCSRYRRHVSDLGQMPLSSPFLGSFVEGKPDRPATIQDHANVRIAFNIVAELAILSRAPGVTTHHLDPGDSGIQVVMVVPELHTGAMVSFWGVEQSMWKPGSRGYKLGIMLLPIEGLFLLVLDEVHSSAGHQLLGVLLDYLFGPLDMRGCSIVPSTPCSFLLLRIHRLPNRIGAVIWSFSSPSLNMGVHCSIVSMYSIPRLPIISLTLSGSMLRWHL